MIVLATLKLDEAIQRGQIAASVWTLSVIILAALTYRWWKKPITLNEATAVQRKITPIPRWFWPSLAALALIAIAVRVRPAQTGLWWDEIWQARYATLGEWKRDKKNPDSLRFEKNRWAETLWAYQKPTNHPPSAVAGRVLHDLWSGLRGSAPGTIHEWVLRAPGWFSLLATIGLIGWGLARHGYPLAGLITGLIYAVHPWIVRYSLDARGYGLLPLFTALACLGLEWLRVTPQRWRGYGLFGLSLALILWAHLLHVWLATALTLTAGVLLWQHVDPPSRVTAGWRLLVSLALGSAVFFHLFGPNLVQVLHWDPSKNQDGHRLTGSYLITTGWHILTGAERLSIAAMLPAALVVVGSFFAFFFVSRRQEKFYRSLMIFSLGLAGLFMLWVSLSDFFFLHRFVFGLSLTLALALGLGFDCLWKKSVGTKIVAISGLGFFLLNGAAELWRLQKKPFSPYREVAAWIEQQPKGPVLGYGFGAEAFQFYYPNLLVMKSDPGAEKLKSLLSENSPPLLVVSYEDFNRSMMPEGFCLIDETYTPVHEAEGLDSLFKTRVFRLKTPATK